MKRFTQSNVVQGNCWQTAVACVLEVEPAELPDQSMIEAAKKSYNNSLQAYLIKHHGLMYGNVPVYQHSALRPRADHLGGYHVMCGPTVRTETNGGINHCVVGRFGRQVWDVHPSRASLLSVKEWGVLGHATPELIEYWRVRDEIANPEKSPCCVCPRCIRPEWAEVFSRAE